MTDLLVFGVDGMSPNITHRNLDKLPTIRKLSNQDRTNSGVLKSFTTGGHKTPHTGPCLTPDVRAYTKEGLKTYKELSVGDEVLSISPDKQVEWKKVTKVMTRQHDGVVYDIEHSKVSATVTPDHNMAVVKGDKIIRKKAEEVNSTFRIPTHGASNPEKTEETGFNEDMAEFLGWFIADGNINGNEIRIAKTIPKYREKIKSAIEKIGYDYYTSGPNIIIYSPDLAKELKQKIGKKSIERHIPKDILSNFSAIGLINLYETLMDADGARKERNKYHTSSKELAYDFAELCIRLGYSAHVENRGGGKQEIKGKVYDVHDRYRVHVATEDTETEIRKHRHWEAKPYKGLVWDIEVEDNHTFLAERNGKLHFTGNCWTTMYTGVKPSKHGITEGGWRTGDSNFNGIHTIFDELSENNISMGLYELIMGYPAKKINGWMLSGFVSPPIKSKFPDYYYPNQMKETLPPDTYKNTTTYVAKKVLNGAAPSTDSDKAYISLKNMSERQLKIFKKINMRRDDDPDLAWFGTTFADKMGHVNGIRNDELTIKTYQYIDYMLQELIETTNPDDVMIVSDHGFTEYTHDINGYKLNTTNNRIDNLYNIAPAIADYFDIEYKKEKFGKQEESMLSEEEKESIQNRLKQLGYI